MEPTLPNFWSIEVEEDRAQVGRDALETSAEIKVAKVFPVNDDTWASIELFFSSIENAQQIPPRAIRELAAAVSPFRQKMRG